MFTPYLEVDLCRHKACLDRQCPLCKVNPNKKCQWTYVPKICVGEDLGARCGAVIDVELRDEQNRLYSGHISDMDIEVGSRPAFLQHPRACACGSIHQV
jgi:hypothetical protein